VKSVNAITEAIIGDAIAIHREMGPGLLESTYEACLAALLARRGLKTSGRRRCRFYSRASASIVPTGSTSS
jgi:GxxExxY protein